MWGELKKGSVTKSSKYSSPRYSSVNFRNKRKVNADKIYRWCKERKTINIKDTAVIGVKTDCWLRWQYSTKTHLNVHRQTQNCALFAEHPLKNEILGPWKCEGLWRVTERATTTAMQLKMKITKRMLLVERYFSLHCDWIEIDYFSLEILGTLHYTAGRTECLTVEGRVF